jgi:hypothetical protein
VIIPPDVAETGVIAETAVVSRDGIPDGSVINDNSSPYPVPALFVAYALT